MSTYFHSILEEKEVLIKKHAPLVKKIAYPLKGRLLESISIDDLVQAGMMGLLEAIRNYNANKGASFETYAAIRIRGTMLDEVRRNDWVPRSVYRSSRELSECIRSKDSEIANTLGVNLNEYYAKVQAANVTKLLPNVKTSLAG